MPPVSPSCTVLREHKTAVLYNMISPLAQKPKLRACAILPSRPSLQQGRTRGADSIENSPNVLELFYDALINTQEGQSGCCAPPQVATGY
jgi:hypothetical protein